MRAKFFGVKRWSGVLPEPVSLFPSRRAKLSSLSASLLLVLVAWLLAVAGCSMPNVLRGRDGALGDGGYQGFLSGSLADAAGNNRPYQRPEATPTNVPAGGSMAVGPYEYDRLNDQARFLAGMPGGANSPLRSLRETGAWQSHRQTMDHLWNFFANTRYGRVQTWRDTEMPDLVAPGVVFYPFSGPDFLFADAFFPGAQQYVMCGLEGTDPLPHPTQLSAPELTQGLSGISASLDTVLGASYFITREMNVDLQATRFRGTLPLLMVFMARTGHVITDIRGIDLTPAGEAVGRGAAGNAAPGWHIVCQTPQGQRKDVYYFREDLSNDTLATDKRLLSFVNSRGVPVTFVKSASYLMHDSHFSIVRNQVLSRSLAVLQDPSGVPYRYFQNRGWNLALYGNYVTTLDVFKDNYQPDMAAAFRYHSPHPVKPMDFGIGYQQSYATSSLMLARSRTVADVTPVARPVFRPAAFTTTAMR